MKKMKYIVFGVLAILAISTLAVAEPLDDVLDEEMEMEPVSKVCLAGDTKMNPVIPEEGYLANDTKMNIYKQGYIKGDVSYTYGDPFYQCIWGDDSEGNRDTATYNINLSADIPVDDIKEARLYVYWTWPLVDMCDKTTYASTAIDYAVYPELEVEFNGAPVTFSYAAGTNRIDHYTDSKNNSMVGREHFEDGYVTYNFPSGTDPSKISEGVQRHNVVNVTNVYPYRGPEAGYCPDPYINGTGRCKVCIQGVGLLVTYEIDGRCINLKKYWVAEGNDMTYVKWNPCECEFTGPPEPLCERKAGTCEWKYGITPEMATTKVTFPGAVPFWMNKATLTSVIPEGDSADNRLYFNSFVPAGTGLWAASPDPDFAVSVTDVSDNLLRGRIPKYDNVAGFRNGLYAPDRAGERQMNVATAILVVESDWSTLDKASRREMRKVGPKELMEEEL